MAKASQPTDHPRGCGEHVGFLFLLGRSQGSSPRMRGALFVFYRLPRYVGIIPADAGSTQGNTKIDYPFVDHPRGCGEHV